MSLVTRERVTFAISINAQKKQNSSFELLLSKIGENSNVSIQVFDWGIREGMKKLQEWADIASRKKAIALLP